MEDLKKKTTVELRAMESQIADGMRKLSPELVITEPDLALLKGLLRQELHAVDAEIRRRSIELNPISAKILGF